ncbi:cysteine desulfurase [Ruminococcaceae bacterium OttesenSCG-928-I18]|nr:cysteine desulfurase [Ruminococcaceae bacterium OttesenSCG-928-I18]
MFTASGTEADNIAVFGAALQRKSWGDHIVATGYEHPGVAAALQVLVQRHGFRLQLAAPDAEGKVDPQQLLDAMGPKTVLLCAMQVNNETGAVLDTAALAREAKKKNNRTAVHVDAVQAFTKLPLGLEEGKIDTCAVSGHKLHAPKGVGALYVREGFTLLPYLAGGGQEYGLRPGTENIAYIAGFTKAVSLALQKREEKQQHLKKLRLTLTEGLPQLGDVVLNSPPDGWHGICNFSVPGYKSEVLLHHLEKSGVLVSSGSACAKGQPSHTLQAMGLPQARVDSAIRVSFCADNTEEDVQALLHALREGMNTLARKK